MENKIAMKYLKGKFFIDILASLPFDSFNFFDTQGGANTLSFKIFGLLKLIRILRLSKLISYMNLKDDVKMSLKLAKLVFFLIMYLHCVGCMWYYIVNSNQVWFPALDDTDDPSEFYDSSSIYKYLVCMYQAVLILIGNDILPKGMLQIAFITTIMFAGWIINANTFGNLAVLIQQLNK